MICESRFSALLRYGFKNDIDADCGCPEGTECWVPSHYDVWDIIQWEEDSKTLVSAKKEIESLKAENEKLKDKLLLLQALEIIGIDNWSGYTTAMTWVEKVKRGENPENINL